MVELAQPKTYDLEERKKLIAEGKELVLIFASILRKSGAIEH